MVTRICRSSSDQKCATAERGYDRPYCCLAKSDSSASDGGLAARASTGVGATLVGAAGARGAICAAYSGDAFHAAAISADVTGGPPAPAISAAYDASSRLPVDSTRSDATVAAPSPRARAAAAATDRACVLAGFASRSTSQSAMSTADASVPDVACAGGWKPRPAR
jgi:hypothetical protein